MNRRLNTLITTTAAISTTETQVIGVKIPPNTLEVGDEFTVFASGVATSSANNAVNIRCRVGPTTLTGTIPAVVTVTGAATGTNVPWDVELDVIVRSIGSAGTILGNAVLTNNSTTGLSNVATVVGQVTAAVAIDTTVDNWLELTAVTAAATTTLTVYQASIFQVSAPSNRLWTPQAANAFGGYN